MGTNSNRRGEELACRAGDTTFIGDYEWFSLEQQDPEELFGCWYFWAGSTE